MYMLALAIVGATPRDPLPQPPETRATDPSDYVTFPYDFSIKYMHRANAFVRNALCVHTGKIVFQMLQTRDEEERGMWVAAMRDHGNRTLGKIFQ